MTEQDAHWRSCPLDLVFHLKNEAGELLAERTRRFDFDVSEKVPIDSTITFDVQITTGRVTHEIPISGVALTGGRTNPPIEIVMRPSRVAEIGGKTGRVFDVDGAIRIASASIVPAAVAKPRKRRVSYPAGNPVGFATPRSEIERKK